MARPTLFSIIYTFKLVPRHTEGQ